MSSLKLAAGALVLSLTVNQALAVTPTPATVPVPPAAPARVETLTPSDKAGALFVNVRRIFALYGDLIKKQKEWAKVEEAIAKGCPDPSKDIAEVGVCTDINKFLQSDVGAIVTGSVDLGKTLKFLTTLDKPGSPRTVFTPSNYRGVTLMSAVDDKTKFQLGAYDEHTNVLSFSESNENPLPPTKTLVSTLKGETPSYSKANNLTLPANYLANLSLKVSQELRDQAAAATGNQFAVIKKLALISASVTADEASKDATAEVRLACDDEAGATELEALLKGLQSEVSAGRATNFLKEIKVSREGATVVLSLAIPKKMVEEAVGGR